MNLLYALESVRTPFWDAVFSAVTHLGEETVFMVAAILIFWCVSKQEGYYLLLMGFFGTVVNQFLKLLFRIPRPWVRDPDFTIVESARAQATGYSFPSGHTQNAVATFGGIARSTRQPWVRWACVAVLLLVSFSRLYLGVHTPLDVGVSFAVAGVMVLTLYPLIRQADRKPSLMAGLIAGMLLVGIAYLVFAYVYPFPADVDAANLAHGQENGWKLLGATVGFGIAWWLDRRYIHFDTRAVWWVQLLKVVLGLALLMGIRAGLKGPLLALFGRRTIVPLTAPVSGFVVFFLYKALSFSSVLHTVLCTILYLAVLVFLLLTALVVLRTRTFPILLAGLPLLVHTIIDLSD